MKGFTLIELLIVMGITLMLGASALGYSRSGEETLNLQISVQKVLSDMNQITSYALSSPARRGFSPAQYYCGFGIHLTPGSESYEVFGDIRPASGCSQSDRRYVPGTDDRLYLSMLKHAVVEDTGVSDILFIPPDPIMYVTRNGLTATTTTGVEIRIRGRGNQPTSSVCVNPIGQATIKRNNSC
ncbi:MAG: prepilin-type N-terminal cleavage/methylation domain-containing protein [Parcubacteria group bacterium]|nr:prepilin-type N-terminal cleavage/methylation domain-containing protein [Parcubacteria group bacterium]